jgi:3-deoxy-D-manno-octulosonate 8-phosphate phosphatase (KDO 8-P phosphatase)
MALPHQVKGNVERIRFLLLDVDGVLTDGRIGLLPDGEEIKYFSIYDGLAIRLAQRAGIEVGFITGRSSRVVGQRALELGVKTVIQGSEDKSEDFRRILQERNLKAEEVAYIGDDLPDIPLLEQVGFAAAPDNAAEPVKYRVHYVTRAKGGDGAVREVIDLLLKTSGKWEQILESLGAGDTPTAG